MWVVVVVNAAPSQFAQADFPRSTARDVSVPDAFCFDLDDSGSVTRHGAAVFPVGGLPLDGVYWAAPACIFFSSSSFRASRLKLAPFCIGGKSMKVCAYFASS